MANLLYSIGLALWPQFDLMVSDDVAQDLEHAETSEGVGSHV